MNEIDSSETYYDAGWDMTIMKITEETKRRVMAKIEFIKEFGDEADIIALARVWNPAITPDQLKRVVKLYHDVLRDRGHSPRSR